MTVPTTLVIDATQQTLEVTTSRDAISLRGRDIETGTPTNGEVLTYSTSASEWIYQSVDENVDDRVAALIQDSAGGGLTWTYDDAAGTLTPAYVGDSTLVTCGALNSGSITSGFTSIDVGSGAITTTGTVSATTLAGTLSTAAQTNITSIGTLAAGAVPASLVTAATFGAGAYVFPSTLGVTGVASLNNITNNFGTTSGANTTVNVLGNDATAKILQFGSATDATVASIQGHYNGGSHLLAFYVNGTQEGRFVAGKLQVSNALEVTGDLVVSGTGPHAIGGGNLNYVQMHFTGAFTSSGASTTATGILGNQSITGASGDTGSICAMRLASTLKTQTATESIGYISQLCVEEPNIQDNLTGDITVASTVYIKNAPTEGESNYALLVDDGAVKFDTSLELATGATVTGIDDGGVATGSATLLATQGAIKTYVDAQVTAQDLDIITSSGNIDIDLDSESLTLTGGTGLASSASSTTVTFAIDSTVATLSGSQTLTNKTIAGGSNTLSAIANGSLTNSTVSYGGVTLALGASDATPAFDLADATNYGAADLTGSTLASGVTGSSLTSVGTLTALQVDNLSLNGNTISTTAGTDLLITPVGGQQIVLDGAVVIDAGVVTGATSITSDVFVGPLTGTASVATVANTVVVVDSTDATSNIAMFDSATGSLAVKTDSGITYNSSTAALSTTTFVGALNGNASGSSGSTTGNAATATALATARTIGGTSFDGTANIAVGLAATATALATARTIGGTSFDGTANIAVALSATATALATARAINGVNFDGTAAITVTAAAGTLTGGTLNSGVTASSLTSLGTIGSLVATSADINGGTLDGATVGASSASTGAFTTLAASSTLAVTGNIGQGGVPWSGAAIRGIGTTSGASGQYGFLWDGTFDSSATANGIGVGVTVKTVASLTMTNGYGVRIQVPGLGSGSAITNLYGLKIENQAVGGTNYAIYTGTGAVSFGDTLAVTGHVGIGQATESTVSLASRCDDDTNSLGLLVRNASGTAVLHTTGAGLTTATTLAVTGALSKGSGSFKIAHPLPAKADTHHLVHSFIEGPQADLIYRGVAALSGGSATVDLDEAAGMSAGTWELLCRDPQVWVQNDSGWGAVRGSVEGNTLTIECESSSDTVSWMVVAERCDPHMMETGWTDDNGRVIVEPEREEGE